MQRAEKKLYLDKMVNRGSSAQSEQLEEVRPTRAPRGTAALPSPSFLGSGTRAPPPTRCLALGLPRASLLASLVPRHAHPRPPPSCPPPSRLPSHSSHRRR